MFNKKKSAQHAPEPADAAKQAAHARGEDAVADSAQVSPEGIGVDVLAQAIADLANQKAEIEDASWSRVERIAQLLVASETGPDDIRNLAAELGLIAQVNAQMQRSWGAPDVDAVREQAARIQEQAAQDAARKAEEEVAKKAEEEAARKAEEEAAKKAEAEEAAKKAEKEAAKKAEEEAARKAEEEAKLAAQKEDAQKAGAEKASQGEAKSAPAHSREGVVSTEAASEQSPVKPEEPIHEAAQPGTASGESVQQPALTGAAAIEALTSEAPTFEDSKLPDWAQHDGDGDQEALNAFFTFEDKDEKGRTRRVPVIIPRGETGALPSLSASGKIRPLGSEGKGAEASVEQAVGEPDFAGFDKMATSGEPLKQGPRHAQPSAGSSAKENADDKKVEEAPEAHDQASKEAKTQGKEEKTQETWSQRRARKKQEKAEEKARKAAEEQAKKAAEEETRKAKEAEEAAKREAEEEARKAAEEAERKAREAEEAAKRAAEEEAARKRAEEEARKAKGAEEAKKAAEQAAAEQAALQQAQKEAELEAIDAAAAALAAEQAAAKASVDASQGNEDGSDGAAAADRGEPLDLSSFREVYTSRDGSIALYEDAEGHITAVNMKKLV